METQIVAAISHIKNTSKKKPTNERILFYLNKEGATNWDDMTVKEVLCYCLLRLNLIAMT